MKLASGVHSVGSAWDVGSQRYIKDIIAKLNAAIVTALGNPILQQKLIDLGQEIPPRDQQTPEALSADQKAEAEKWWPIIKAANIKGE